MEEFIVKAQLAVSDAEAALLSGDFKQVNEKYIEAASLYAAAIRRSSDPNTSETLEKLRNHYNEKAAQIQEYLDPAITAEASEYSIEYDGQSNYDDYYYLGNQKPIGAMLDPNEMSHGREPSPRGIPGPPAPSPATPSERMSVSPLDKLVFPITRGYQTVKNLVYTYSGGQIPGRSRVSSPGSSGPNSLDESFFFIQPDDLVSVEQATPLVPSGVQTEPASTQPKGTGQGSSSSSTTTSHSELQTVTIDRSQYQQLMEELNMLRATVIRLKEQNSKLMQRGNSSGVQNLVRENTALRRSLITLQRKERSGIWPSDATSSINLGDQNMSSSSIPHAQLARDALVEENERLRRDNESMMQRVNAWKERWNKLKTTALQKQQRRNSESSSYPDD